MEIANLRGISTKSCAISRESAVFAISHALLVPSYQQVVEKTLLRTYLTSWQEYQTCHKFVLKTLIQQDYRQSWLQQTVAILLRHDCTSLVRTTL